MISFVVNIGLLLGALGMLSCLVLSCRTKRSRAPRPRLRCLFIGSLVLVLLCPIAGIATNRVSKRRCLDRFELATKGMDMADVAALMGEPVERRVVAAGTECIYNIPQPITWFWSVLSRPDIVSSRELVVFFDTEDRVAKKSVQRSMVFID